MKLAGKVGCGAKRVQSAVRREIVARAAESGFNPDMETATSTLRPPLWLRLVRTLGSYVFACLAAASVLLLALLAVAAAEPDDILSLSANDLGGAAIFIAIATAYIAVIAALPALGAVWLARALRWPRGWSDAGTGALIGLAAGHLLLCGFSLSPPQPLDLVFILAGAIAGLVYWLANARPRPPYRAAR